MIDDMLREGIHFHYQSVGDGLPLILQHGMGGDVGQPFGLFSPPPGVRLIGFDCRGHGQTSPLGNSDRLRFAVFADDLVALMDHLGVGNAVVGGISMGAGVALSAALSFPHRLRGLILIRPAWLDGPMPAIVRQHYATIASLIRQYGVRQGREVFLRSATYLTMNDLSPVTAASLVGQFDRVQAEKGVAVLEQLPQDTPIADIRALAGVTMPALILANEQDPIHPLDYGQQLAGAIPGAQFKEVTPKAVNNERHRRDVQESMEQFLRAYDAH